MIQPPRWDADRLEQDRQQAIELFRKERLREPVENYTQEVDDRLAVVEELLEATVDLQQLDEDQAIDILTDEKYLDAFRYLAGPPISKDDLKTLAGVSSFSKKRLRNDPDAVRRLTQVVFDAVDRRRFPWLTEGREPNEAERDAAILASACVWAYQRAQTERRSEGRHRLEDTAEEYLIAAGLQKTDKRRVDLLQQAPDPGFYYRETEVADRRADFVAGLWDGRHLLVECKDSNSFVNSIKRLNNDTAAKAVHWTRKFGEVSVVPVAILSGVYDHESLRRAQEAGLYLFWGHGMGELADWLKQVREEAQGP